LVRAIILVKSPKKLIAARIRRIDFVSESFPVSGQFDAIAVIQINELNKIKDITTQIQKISGVERTETMVEVNT
jgi:DNA-binding Lrp family transcriptional regulator